MSRLIIIFVIVLSTLPLTQPSGANAHLSAQSSSNTPLTDCKFEVGLGAVKTPVDAKCATVKVPQDYSKPDGQQIDLAVVVLSAFKQTDKGVPIFYFEGGPGGSAISNFGLTFYGAFRGLREKHDVVIIDQRGTGKSSSLQCTEFTEKALEDLATAPSENTELDIAVERAKTCLTRLASEKKDPAFYTSIRLADDTNMVRKALGYDKINLFGSSYGTWLAQIYMARHSATVRAAILDSVAGPWNNYLLVSNTNAQQSLDRLFELCANDSECNRVYPNLRQKLDQAVALLDKEPVRTTGTAALSTKNYPLVITRSRFLDGLRSMLYLGGNLGILPQVISQSANGNFSLIASQIASAAELSGEVSLGLYYSVHCSESLPFYTEAILKQTNTDDFFNTDDFQNDALVKFCKNWRSAELEAVDVAPLRSDIPTLIFSGAFDPITPISFGEETEKRLINSKLVVFPYQGHVPLAASRCAQNLAVRFLETNNARGLDISCVQKDVKPIFAGAYTLSVERFRDPKGNFSAGIPKGWQAVEGKGNDTLTFFASPDGQQQLGVGVLKQTTIKDAQAKALAAIREAYGDVDLQLSFSQSLIILSITVVQHSVSTPDDYYLGALIIVAQPGETRLLWLATPPNIFQAALLEVTAKIVPTLSSR